MIKLDFSERWPQVMARYLLLPLWSNCLLKDGLYLVDWFIFPSIVDSRLTRPGILCFDFFAKPSKGISWRRRER